ncbi:MAG: helix-turn-helix domain-containing protein [Acidobacteriota bacterium]
MPPRIDRDIDSSQAPFGSAGSSVDASADDVWRIESKDVERLTADVCPALSLFRLLGSHWTVPLLYQLQTGSGHRPGELERAIPGLSRRELHRRLEALVAAGIVRRKAFAEIPPRVEYRLTTRGEALVPSIRALCEWAERDADRGPTQR